MYNYYQQQPNLTSTFNRPQPYTGLKGHPVSSLEEVRATSIDFDGSIFYFPDIANKRIYTKTVGIDGIASLNMYELKPIPTEPEFNDFITRKEFETAMGKVAELFNQKNTTVPKQETPSSQQQNFKEVF